VIDTLSALLGAGAVPQTSYGPESRYYGAVPLVYVTPDGRSISYVPRRFIPQPDRYATIQLYSVPQGARVDVIAAQFLGDPLLYWRLCDANAAVRPDDLELLGRILRITLPAGVPGTPP
jgi:hypothetical protein